MTALTLALLLAAALPTGPTPVGPIGPGTRFDPRIPTLEQVAGHAPGQAITTPEAIQSYLAALAAAAPDRARLFEYARSEEGRPLSVLVIASPERIARLDELKRDLRALADPRPLPAGEADRLLRELPAVVWLLHGVHGNEVSSSDAALALAYHLLAAEDDEAAEAARRDAVVLLDPLENPDGRARFLATNGAASGPAPDPEPLAAEHDEPWPGGRANHYLFDMNRDWFAQTQPETRGRLRVFLDWYPQVAVDLHEMGGNSTYYFAPPARPYNPHFSAAQGEWLEAFGRAIAARFDAAGQAYFVRDVFDSFYPGYGESWPMTHGAVGMTFEQASARGLAWRREDGTTLTFLDGVRNHFRAALATVEAAARGREKLLRDFLEFRRAAVREGETATVRAYVLPPGGDPPRTRRLAELLVGQGVEVRVASGELRAGARTFPAGTFVVPLAQPAGRLARNLLDPGVAMDDAFIREQDRRRKRRLPDQIYDVTAWSLPLLFDVECVGVGVAPAGDSSPFAATPPPAPAPLAPARVAWLLPWGSGTAAAVAEALASGVKVRVAEEGFRLGDRTFSAGTAVVRASENAEEAVSALGRAAVRRGVLPVAVDSGFVEEGLSLGSDRVRAVPKPRVALLWDRPASSTSAGWARWVLERRFGQPVTVVRTASLRRLDLRRYGVLVLPSGDYSDAIGGAAASRLREWVESGGTLVALGEAALWLTRDKVGLLATKTELKDGRPDTEDEAKPEKGGEGGGSARDKAAPAKEPFDLEKAILPERERPDAVPGALLRVELDREHWLSAGTDGALQALVESRRVFTPLKLDKGRNVGVYAKKDAVVASGLVWDETRDLLAQKAFLMEQPLGRGHVVAFAEDPNNRGYAEGTELVFMNAVLLGPAY